MQKTRLNEYSLMNSWVIAGVMSLFYNTVGEGGGSFSRQGDTLTRGCLKVHGGVPIVLCLFGDPRINCLVFRECLTALFLNPES